MMPSFVSCISGAWILSRDLAEVPLAEVYEHVGLRVPMVDTNLPARNDALGRAGSRAMDELRAALHDPLQRSIASYLHPHREPHA